MTDPIHPIDPRRRHPAPIAGLHPVQRRSPQEEREDAEARREAERRREAARRRVAEAAAEHAARDSRGDDPPAAGGRLDVLA